MVILNVVVLEAEQARKWSANQSPRIANESCFDEQFRSMDGPGKRRLWIG